MGNDFDFQTNLAEFNKVNTTEDINANDVVEYRKDEVFSIGSSSVYHKNEFFDSISCDVLDKYNGIDNRLRGSDERNLNTETFGAVSLGNRRRGVRKNKRGYSIRGRGRDKKNGYAIRYNDSSRLRENNQCSREPVDISGSNKTLMSRIDNKKSHVNQRKWADHH